MSMRYSAKARQCPVSIALRSRRKHPTYISDKMGYRLNTIDVVQQQAEVEARGPPVLPKQPVLSPLEPAGDTEPEADTGPEAHRLEPALDTELAASGTCNMQAGCFRSHRRGSAAV
ncbi:hypothetical protein BDP81DRAFT_419307 [Colletotrichum phormii]|uniref:Uncharacterized protein n=1 Tax=Colletotrichum phormii TaxID=359342 RepID=A0AAJ0A0V1_9PEZI|nr:uncharacterized protein BDP81DRAFT_419307 [Colletotrichum phormii]KAK1640067.1 hypothetical protein BDP81DRAFT_419307 [Colletotrichum phormii]